MDFYKRALHEFAASIAPGVRLALEKTIIDAYQSAAAHGITTEEDVIKEWDELGAVLSSDHHLREMALGELRSKIDAMLKGLAYSDDLALWIAYGLAFEFLDVNEPIEYDGMHNNSAGKGEVIEHICRRIANAAANDWEARLPAPIKSDDEDYLQSLIDGTTNMFAEDIFERLEPMFATYESDAPMMDLLTRASEAYVASSVKAARNVLNSQVVGDPSGDESRTEVASSDGDPLGGIVILSVHDKDGNRHPELEDDVTTWKKE